MSKSIRNILMVLGIAILIPIIFMIIVFSSLEINIIDELNKEISKFTNDTVLKIGNDGIIEVTETINFKIGKLQTELPEFYLVLDDNYRYIGEEKGETFDIEILLDGTKLEEKDYRIDDDKYWHDYIKLLNYDFSNHNERTLIIKHKYYVSQFVEEYNNVTVLNLNDETKYREHSIKIILPKSTSKFIIQDDFGMYGNAVKKS